MNSFSNQSRHDSNIAIVVTTINAPRREFLKWLEFPHATLIVVSDKKTCESEWVELQGSHHNLVFLSTVDQEVLFPSLSKSIGWNTYSRKNIGYLVALRMGFSRIFETDDDTFPRPSIGRFINISENTKFVTQELVLPQPIDWWNPYEFFAPHDAIWPRGWPLDMISNLPHEPIYQESITDLSQHTSACLQFLVNGDPDVDAIFRLVNGNQRYEYSECEDIVSLPQRCISMGNTQATLYIGLRELLYTPATCSPRVCDIVKSWIIQSRTHTLFGGFLVHQDRNEHNLLSDFALEVPLYLKSQEIAESIWQTSHLPLVETYQELIRGGILDSREIDIFLEFRESIPE